MFVSVAVDTKSRIAWFEIIVHSLLKNMLAGISSILVVAPVSRAHEINLDDYMKHGSDIEALESDWLQVASDLKEAAAKDQSGTQK